MRLTKPVVIQGRTASFFAPLSRLKIETTTREGVWWQSGPEDFERVADCRLITSADKQWPWQRILRCLFLQSAIDPRRELRVSEHLFGVLHLLDATGILLQSEDPGLPYEGNGRFFWEGLSPAMQSCEDTGGSFTVKQPVEVVRSRRKLRWRPGGDPLKITAAVQYPGTDRIEVSYRLDDESAELIACSRPYGREGVMRSLARWHGVTEHYAWERGFGDPEHGVELLEDIARHRILDLLGALEMLRQRYGPLFGEIHTEFADHQLDVEMINLIERGNLLVRVT